MDPRIRKTMIELPEFYTTLNITPAMAAHHEFSWAKTVGNRIKVPVFGAARIANKFLLCFKPFPGIECCLPIKYFDIKISEVPPAALKAMPFFKKTPFAK